MTKAQLLAALAPLPDDAKILINAPSGLLSDIKDISILDNEEPTAAEDAFDYESMRQALISYAGY